MPDSSEIRNLLHLPYDRDTWEPLLVSLFPEGSLTLFQTPQPLEATHEKVTATLQLGTLTLPGDDQSIAILEVTTTSQLELARNRVGLRNYVANFIDQANATGVLAVFQQPGSSDWRLTYAARTTTLDQDTFQITTVETAPRRYTFLLGENEPCRTAAARLVQLREKSTDLSLKDLELAFSVESLTKDFFRKYKEQYQTFIDHLLSPDLAAETRELFNIEILDNEAAQEKADKPVRDFVKTLLGRLVFLTFLQKKGWLGCPAGSRPWKNGQEDFLQSFLKLATENQEADLFHSKYLTALFFEALNLEDRDGDLFALTGTRLPYLNGGLFEDDDDHARSIDFPSQLFTDLLNFFDEYNFTIDENDPEDHEVGIDPEMLGMIFENLLEDNKEKGTYYTPKAIVSYMARQSLLHYLQTHLGENKALETLLNEKNSEALPSFIEENKARIIDLLEKVTICDPAIGSGAFPIGLLHEILWTRLTLEDSDKNTSKFRAELKRAIIQNSIHGVDLDPGAIEIARLRFWLALVVDEDKPRPLPNLDYKIHRADSLIEYIRGEAVNLGTETPKDASTRAAVTDLTSAKQTLFTAQGLPGKRKAWFALYRALAQLAQAEFTWLRNETDFTDGEKMALLNKGIKDFGQWITKIDAIQRQPVHLQEKLRSKLRLWFDDEEQPTFLWNLHFGGIFAQGGFDIVIANPPYVRNQNMSPEYKDLLWPIYETLVKKADLYTCFYEKGLKLSKEKGVICFITSNTFMRLDSFTKLRNKIIRDSNIFEVIEFTGNVFNTATVKTSLVLLSPTKQPAENTSILYRTGLGATDTLLATPKAIPLWFWNESHQQIFDTSFTLGGSSLNRKILNGGQALQTDYSTSFGLKTGDDQRWIMDRKPEHFGERLFRGRDVTSSGADWHGLYVEYNPVAMRAHRSTARPGTRERFEQEKILVSDTGDCLEAFWDKEGLFVKDLLIIHAKDKCGNSLGFLTSLLNSQLMKFHYELSFPTLHVQQNELKILPIPPATDAEKAELTTLAEKCAAAAAKDDQATLAIHEAEINQIVYRLFDLTPEEISLIVTSLGLEPETPTSITTKLVVDRRIAHGTARLYLIDFLPYLFSRFGEPVSFKQLFQTYHILCNLGKIQSEFKGPAKKWATSFNDPTDLNSFVAVFREAVSGQDLEISDHGLLKWIGSPPLPNKWLTQDAEQLIDLIANSPISLPEVTDLDQSTIISPILESFPDLATA